MGLQSGLQIIVEMIVYNFVERKQDKHVLMAGHFRKYKTKVTLTRETNATNFFLMDEITYLGMMPLIIVNLSERDHFTLKGGYLIKIFTIDFFLFYIRFLNFFRKGNLHTSAAEAKLLGNYFHEWNRAGVSRIWIELSDLETEKPSETCRFTYPDTSREPGYTDWAGGKYTCNEMAHTCAYVDTLLTSNNWKTESCGGSEERIEFFGKQFEKF